MYKVTYTVKNDDGFLVDKTKKFDVMQDACKLIRDIAKNPNKYNVVGRPTVERS